MLQFLKDNPGLAVALYVAIMAGIAFAEKKLEASPRGQGALKILTALGIDLPKVGEGIAQLFGGTPPPPPMAGARRGITSALAAMAALAALSLLAAGCGWFTPARQADVATIAACVLAHEGDPALQIGVECAISDIAQIEQILSAHRLAEHREQAADAGTP